MPMEKVSIKIRHKMLNSVVWMYRTYCIVHFVS